MRFIRLENVKPGMILGRDVYGSNRTLLLRHGGVIGVAYIEKLRQLGYAGIYIEDKHTQGMEMYETIDHTTRQSTYDAVQNLFTSDKISDNSRNAAAFREIEDLLEAIISQIIANKDAVVTLTSLKNFDDYTYQHSVDVSILAVVLGRQLKLRRSELLELGTAALFHDIGKMSVPAGVLNKPGILTEEEFEQMKAHTHLSSVFLKAMKQKQSVCEGALHHHEKYDGSGYPSKLAKNDIPLYARIIAIADVYDAITSKRVYKDNMPASEAYEFIMSNSGKHFDPEVVDAFLRKIAPYPVGTSVVLSDGRIGLVIENRPNLMMRPLLKILEESNLILPEVYLDLASDSTTNITIVGTL